MAEVIQIRDLQAARRRADRRTADHQSIERAVALMRENLAWAVERLETASVAEQLELLDRIEKLSATIRYGLLLLGGPVANCPAGVSPRGAST
jgi:CRISPR/Cas system CSM-associated protein Csm2 small subunit